VQLSGPNAECVVLRAIDSAWPHQSPRRESPAPCTRRNGLAGAPPRPGPHRDLQSDCGDPGEAARHCSDCTPADRAHPGLFSSRQPVCRWHCWRGSSTPLASERATAQGGRWAAAPTAARDRSTYQGRSTRLPTRSAAIVACSDRYEPCVTYDFVFLLVPALRPARTQVCSAGRLWDTNE
jgi:hypothetical protein